MAISDEMLMAYADGEFDGPESHAERLAIEAAVAADPAVARQIENHRALRRQLGALHAATLDEPVPDRLVAAVRQAVVTNLAEVRAAKRVTAVNTPRAWPQSKVWLSMAASLVVGLFAGLIAYSVRNTDVVSMSNGQLTARSTLDRALTEQLASESLSASAVQVGVSFKAKSGEYCRTFLLQQGEALTGLACRSGQTWRVQTLARVESPAKSTEGYRLAGSVMPAAVRAAVEAQIDGEPLDAQGEALARQHDWK
jgi:hypothetical protein